MHRAARILLVDDEISIQRGLVPLLASRGYEVEGARMAAAAIQAFERAAHDLVVLDLGLPDLEGSEVCRRIRARSRVPIIVLSARGSDMDKISALDLGADDYVTKPFSPEELLARVRVALRRAFTPDQPESGEVRLGDLTVDFDRRRLRCAWGEVRLTPKEFELLAYLARRPNRVLTHRALLTAIWGAHSGERTENLWVLVSQLRKKLEPDPARPRYLISEPWVGYRLAAD